MSDIFSYLYECGSVRRVIRGYSDAISEIWSLAERFHCILLCCTTQVVVIYDKHFFFYTCQGET